MAANDAIMYIRNRHHHSNNKMLTPSLQRKVLLVPSFLDQNSPPRLQKKPSFFPPVDPSFMTSIPTYSITVQCALWLHKLYLPCNIVLLQRFPILPSNSLWSLTVFPHNSFITTFEIQPSSLELSSFCQPLTSTLVIFNSFSCLRVSSS